MSGALFLCLEKDAVVARVFVPELFLLPNRCSQAVEILDVNRNGSFRSQVPFSPVTLALGDSGVASGSGVGRCQWLVGKCRAARATINRSLQYCVADTVLYLLGYGYRQAGSCT